MIDLKMDTELRHLEGEDGSWLADRKQDVKKLLAIKVIQDRLVSQLTAGRCRVYWRHEATQGPDDPVDGLAAFAAGP
jgi:hypothetical protein